MLERELAEAFGGTDRACRTVARQARDLVDAGTAEELLGHELTATDIVGHLEDAPDDHSLVERWNWWLGSLELADGGYNRFRVRPDVVEE